MSEPWTIYVCEGCGQQVIETYEYIHQGEGHGAHVRTEVVPLARAEAAEARVAELEAALDKVESVLAYRVQYWGDGLSFEEAARCVTIARAALKPVASKGDEAK